MYLKRMFQSVEILKTRCNELEFTLAILIGVGLSASAGFRVFTPLLITSIASYADWVHLAAGFDWIGTMPALLAFLVATLIEVFAYFIPFVDNLVKLMATPAAIIAGTLLMASFIGDMKPFMTWSISIIAGGGVATISQAATAAIRGTSTVVTGGIGNFFVSIVEGVSAIIIAVLSIVLPILSIVFVAIIIFTLIKLIRVLKSKGFNIFRKANKNKVINA